MDQLYPTATRKTVTQVVTCRIRVFSSFVGPLLRGIWENKMVVAAPIVIFGTLKVFCLLPNSLFILLFLPTLSLNDLLYRGNAKPKQRTATSSAVSLLLHVGCSVYLHMEYKSNYLY